MTASKSGQKVVVARYFASSVSSSETTGDGSDSGLISFSEYASASDLLVSWYIQKFIVPLHVEEVAPFNPKDPAQVDLSGIVNAKPRG